MQDESLQRHARHILEWDALLDALAAQTHSAAGAACCQRLPIETDIEMAEIRQLETTEMRTILESSIPFPILAFEDLRAILNRASKGAQLEGLDLFRISVVAELCQQAKQSLQVFHDSCPTLFTLGEPLEPLEWVKQAIDQCIDREGHIRESATPELSRLLQEIKQLRQRTRQRLERLLSSPEYEDFLQGQYFAERESRYVIPVKTELQHQISGIVHDVSGSGATVFLEPSEFIESNNSIKVAELQASKEMGRILQDLSAMVGTHAVSLASNTEILTTLDCVSAKARLSIKLDANPVSLTTQPRIMLKQARHPLLALTKKEVVPNDITIDEETKVFIISGPNTGGKTVTLKLVGLSSLMARAGLHLPCLEGSEIGIFQRTYADIGDAQDLNRDLSSFSAHMTNIIALLAEATSQPHDAFLPSLVLLDEIGSSTDPMEGAALAEALLCRLYELGFTVVVTTHHHALKTLALRKVGFVNASHEFDLNTLSPTYRLIEGLPGGSSAIEIAGQLGLDDTVLAHASELLKGQERDLEQVFRQLQNTQQQLDQELSRTTELRQQAERFQQEARDIKDRLHVTEREARQKIRKDLQTEFSRVKRFINDIAERLKKDKSLLQVKSARETLATLQQASPSLLKFDDAVPLDEMTTGGAVMIRTLGTTGTLLEAPQGKKSVKIRVGTKVMSVSADLLEGTFLERAYESGSDRVHRQTSAHRGPMPSPVASDAEQKGSASLTIDLRGKSVDDAIEATEAAFDQAMVQGMVHVFVIHGHGTGTLKGGLRTYFSESSYVSTFRAGDRSEGGDGVTVVVLR